MSESPGGARRIAFFGGSFDPPHLGHIGVARAAQQALNLDLVVFAPVGAQPLKPLGSTASFEDRVAMTELAIDGLPNFVISLADAPDPSGEPNYSIDTLHRLQAEYPSWELYILMGADSLISLRRWYRAGEIPFVAHMIVASRPGQSLRDLARVLPDGVTLDEEEQERASNQSSSLRILHLVNREDLAAPLYLLDGLDIEISASQIRRHLNGPTDRLCAGHEVLPDRVCAYIAEHGLYRHI